MRADRDAHGHRVRAVIVHYGPQELTCEAVRSVASVSPETEIVVVDHGTEPLRDAFPAPAACRVSVIRPPANLGYGSGCNIGAARCDREFLLFLNNDVRLTEGAVEALVNALDAHPDAAVAGPRFLDASGALAPAVHRLPSPWRLLMENVPLGRLLPFLPAFEGNSTVRQPREGPAAVEAVLGAAFLVRRQAFGGVNGFDAGFFHYAEEDDLFRRFQDAGWRVLFVPAARIVHHGSGASESVPIEQRDRWKSDGFLRYAGKHHRPNGWRRTRRALLLGAGLRLACAWLPGTSDAVPRRRRFSSLVEYLRGLEG